MLSIAYVNDINQREKEREREREREREAHKNYYDRRNPVIINACRDFNNFLRTSKLQYGKNFAILCVIKKKKNKRKKVKR